MNKIHFHKTTNTNNMDFCAAPSSSSSFTGDYGRFVTSNVDSVSVYECGNGKKQSEYEIDKNKKK